MLPQQVFALQDLTSFCSFVLVLQLVIFMLYAVRAAQHPVSTAPVIKHVADTLIASFPTGIPTVVIFSLFRCTSVLQRREMVVLNTGKIKTAAAVQIVALDKTGTLTGNLVTSTSATMRTPCHLCCLLCEKCCACASPSQRLLSLVSACATACVWFRLMSSVQDSPCLPLLLCDIDTAP